MINLDLIWSSFQTDIQLEDFENESTAIVQTINAWVEELKVDRPFLFTIQEYHRGITLFHGKFLTHQNFNFILFNHKFKKKQNSQELFKQINR